MERSPSCRANATPFPRKTVAIWATAGLQRAVTVRPGARTARGAEGSVYPAWIDQAAHQQDRMIKTLPSGFPWVASIFQGVTLRSRS